MKKKVVLKVGNKGAVAIAIALMFGLFLVFSLAGGGFLKLLGFQYESTKAFFDFFLFTTVMILPIETYLMLLNRRIIRLCVSIRQYHVIQMTVEVLALTCLIAVIDHDMELVYIPDTAILAFAVAIVLVKKISGWKVTYKVKNIEEAK